MVELIVEIHSAEGCSSSKINPLLKSWWHPEFSMSMFDLGHFFGVAHPTTRPITPKSGKPQNGGFQQSFLAQLDEPGLGIVSFTVGCPF